MSSRPPLIRGQVFKNGALGYVSNSNKYSSISIRRLSATICTPRRLTLCAIHNSACHGTFAMEMSPRRGNAPKLLWPASFSTSSRYAAAKTEPNASHEHKMDTNNNHSKRAYGRGIMITGGTSGIGYAVAKRAILEGASHVRIVTRDTRRGQATIEKLQQETSTDIDLDYIQAKTTQYGDAKLFQPISSNTPLETIIHCAGITQTSLLTTTSPESITQILQVNLESAALLSKSHLKNYIQSCTSQSRRQKSQQPNPPRPDPNPSWQIINISSLLATKSGYGTSIYTASKAGLIALTRAIALEAAEISKRYRDVAPGFRANVVVPGYIKTPMIGGFSAQTKAKLETEIPAGRFGTSAEVADAVMFLLANEYANNCVLNLDGGLSAT